ncbi:FAD-dependent monooxygenase [Marinibacterium profundimaris]|uniref:FAD-dependent oxidoreductase n=1 Tax=Marinibacterium profundimaris TaxID=1679460 RepID=A0A225NMA7_9RHOB|nr:FAD-dependent monooxygenase [Marinibacterium profundimaris]OWU71668.1 FAD-dependent oxidoreductase [Marinibacterium profundimaris]
MAYEYQTYAFEPPPGLTGPEPRHKVVIVGAGPIGLTLAIDLALRGVPSVVLDDNNVVSRGSRAICWSKRTLEIFDRLGLGERMLARGVTWKVGRQFHGAQEVFSFDLLPEDGHKYPAFINLQQYYVEEYLIERARDFPDLIDLRFCNKVVDHREIDRFVQVEIETPSGLYKLETDWLIACDGAKSPTRERMGLSFEGQVFEEQFLIADIEMEHSPFGDAAVPERWFWFDPPFHPGKSALLHMQPDNIYRIDLQLDVGADAKAEATEEKVMPRIRAIVGDTPFRLDWMSVYKFRCIMLDRFVHGRVIFAGDSAHVVSPFGARGGNGGIQDVDNLGWKLAAVIGGQANENLLESYDAERRHGAEENILNSARSTNFMTPKTGIEALFRAETLRLAHNQPFARKLLNSGRLSLPCGLEGSALITPGAAQVAPGRAMVDAPLDGPHGASWLIEEVQGRFVLVGFGSVPLPEVAGVARIGVNQRNGDYPCFTARSGHAIRRYGSEKAYLFRPDGHVAAVFDAPDAASVAAARDRAMGAEMQSDEAPAPQREVTA